MLENLKELCKDTDKRLFKQSIWNFIPSTPIISFLKESDLTGLKSVTNHKEYLKEIKKLSSNYVTWAINTANIKNDKLAETFTQEDRVDLSNFFKGFMGEYFFRDIVLKMNREGLIVKNNKNGTNVLLNYYDVAPLSIKDFGIDGTCVDNNGKNCVIQVKFWDTNNLDSYLKIAIMQKAYAEGVLNRYIDPYEPNNVIICWLGNDTKVSPKLKENQLLYEHIVFIDSTVLSKTIDRSKKFWTETYLEGIDHLVRIAG